MAALPAALRTEEGAAVKRAEDAGAMPRKRKQPSLTLSCRCCGVPVTAANGRAYPFENFPGGAGLAPVIWCNDCTAILNDIHLPWEDH